MGDASKTDVRIFDTGTQQFAQLCCDQLAQSFLSMYIWHIFVSSQNRAVSDVLYDQDVRILVIQHVGYYYAPGLTRSCANASMISPTSNSLKSSRTIPHS